MGKNLSKASSDASSSGLQALANYHLKEKGEYMSAEDLLKTQQDPKTPLVEGQEAKFPGLQKTDIIQFVTDGFDHWGIYTGLNCVAHFTDDGYIREGKLVDVADGKKCRINNKLKSVESRELVALPPAQILENITRQLGKRKEHHPLQFNSEHQVTEWKYGFAFSDTVDKLIKDGIRVAATVTAGVGGVAVAGPGGIAAAPAAYKIAGKAADSVVDAITASNNSYAAASKQNKNG